MTEAPICGRHAKTATLSATSFGIAPGQAGGFRATMFQAGSDDKVYPVVKIATVVNALQADGVDAAKALQSVHLSREELTSPATRVSLNQVIRCYGAALRLAPDPRFAYRAGLPFH